MMKARNIFVSMIVTYYLLQWIFTVWSDRCICYAIWKMFIPEINTLSYFGWKKNDFRNLFNYFLCVCVYCQICWKTYSLFVRL